MTTRGIDSHPVYAPAALAAGDLRQAVRRLADLHAAEDHALMLSTFPSERRNRERRLADCDAAHDEITAISKRYPDISLAEVVSVERF